MQKLRLIRNDKDEGYERNMYEPSEPLKVKELLKIIFHETKECHITIKDVGRTQDADYYYIYKSGDCVVESNKEDMSKKVLKKYVRVVHEHIKDKEWFIYLLNEKETQEQLKRFKTTKEERINQRVKSMSTIDLQRYILETLAKKFMMEESEDGNNK